jgi:hypothetical protein
MRAQQRYWLAILALSAGLTVAAMYLFDMGHVADDHGTAGLVVSAIAVGVASAVVITAFMPAVRRLLPRVFPS